MTIEPTALIAPVNTGSICGYSFWHILMLDNPVRRYFQNPEKILNGYIKPGMTVIDIGCGPGNFSRALAHMTGEKGSVIAVDLQHEMLEYAEKKCQNDPYFSRITWHQCLPDCLGLTTTADFALSMFMVHEVPDQDRLFSEVFSLLRHRGRYLVIEPTFHVTEEAFTSMEITAVRAGFRVVERPSVPFSRAILLER